LAFVMAVPIDHRNCVVCASACLGCWLSSSLAGQELPIMLPLDQVAFWFGAGVVVGLAGWAIGFVYSMARKALMTSIDQS
jgi:hypothetical protein